MHAAGPGSHVFRLGRTTGKTVNLAVLATVFGVVFVAELPDKTALASLVLGTRYRPGQVFVGVAAAFAVHVAIAIVAGSLLGLLPHRLLEVVVGVLFLVGAVLMLRRKDEPAEEPTADVVGEPMADGVGGGGVATQALTKPATKTVKGFWRVAGTSFLVLFVAEFGDLTQIATANLAARYDDPLAVGVGAVLGLWAVGGLAIVGGRQLLRLVPMVWITRVAAAVMAVLAVVSLVSAVAG
jgi:putative Ca2+/H+ antiporter (TMEM165/GDT1 family)